MLTILFLGLTCAQFTNALSNVSGTVAFDVHRRVNETQANNQHSPLRSVDPNVTVSNHGVWYGIELAIGTPPQNVTVQIDTGSSDLWVASPFNPQLSSTYSSNTTDPFSITYADLSSAEGVYAQDVLHISDKVAVENANFAFATSASAFPQVFGIGLIGDEAGTKYDNIPVQLKNQGIISSVSYSLYLGSEPSNTGQLLFGGVDHSKYEGQLYTVPLTQESSFFVSLDAIYHNKTAIYSSQQSVLLDSGTTNMILSADMVTAIVSAIDPSAAASSLTPSVSCSRLMSSTDALTFDFSGAHISVPFQNLIDPSNLNADGSIPSSGTCSLGIDTTLSSTNILGDRFITAAYIVYDLDNHEVSLANAVADGGNPQIEAIGAAGVPRAVNAPRYTMRCSNSSNSANGGNATCGTTDTSSVGNNNSTTYTAPQIAPGSQSANASTTAVLLAGTAPADTSPPSAPFAKVRNDAVSLAAASGAAGLTLLFFTLVQLLA